MKYLVSFSLNFSSKSEIVKEDKNDIKEYGFRTLIRLDRDKYYDLFLNKYKGTAWGKYSKRHPCDLYFYDRDFNDPCLQGALRELTKLGWHPMLSQDSSHKKIDKNFILSYLIEYEDADLDSMPYLAGIPSGIRTTGEKERYENGLPVVKGRQVGDKTIFYRFSAFGRQMIVHPMVLKALKEKRLTRHLEVRKVAYSLPPKHEMHWLASDIILPKMANVFMPDYLNLSAEDKQGIQDGYGMFPYNCGAGNLCCKYTESQIAPYVPFDFALTNEKLSSSRKDNVESRRLLVVSQDVYRLFKREGWEKLCNWIPVMIYPDDQAPTPDGLGEFGRLLAPYFHPDYRPDITGYSLGQ